MPFEGLNYRHHAVVPAHSKVVTLGDIVSEDNLRALADTAHDGQQHVLLEGLGLIDNHKRVMQGPPPDVRQRQHLQEAAVQHFIHDVLGDHRAKGVENSLGPRVHLLPFRTGQVAQLLPTYGV